MLEGVGSEVPRPTVGATAVISVVGTAAVWVRIIMTVILSVGDSLPGSGRRLVHLDIRNIRNICNKHEKHSSECLDLDQS